MAMEIDKTMRPLIIDEKLKTRIAEIVRFANEHHYTVGETIVPGDDPRYVLNTHFGYRCVFSFTRVPSGLYRDLSISISTKVKYPNPFIAYTLAELFGFTGWDSKTIEPPPATWLIGKDIHFDAIRIAQACQGPTAESVGL